MDELLLIIIVSCEFIVKMIFKILLNMVDMCKYTNRSQSSDLKMFSFPFMF